MILVRGHLLLVSGQFQWEKKGEKFKLCYFRIELKSQEVKKNQGNEQYS